MAAAIPAPTTNLPERVQQLVAAGAAALQRQQAGAAEQSLRAALAAAPGSSEVLRLLGIALRLQNRNAEALEMLRQAALQNPDDPLIQNGLGTALDAGGERDAAIAAFERACELAPGAAQLWANLGKSLGDAGRFAEAAPILERALALGEHSATRLRLAYALRVLGDIDGAALHYRELIARNPADGTALLGLSGLKTRPFAEADIATMEHVLRTATLSADERISLGFALAKALDDHGRYPQAFAMLEQANRQTRQIRPWSAAQFSALTDSVLAAFATVPTGAANGQGG